MVGSVALVIGSMSWWASMVIGYGTRRVMTHMVQNFSILQVLTMIFFLVILIIGLSGHNVINTPTVGTVGSITLMTGRVVATSIITRRINGVVKCDSKNVESDVSGPESVIPAPVRLVLSDVTTVVSGPESVIPAPVRMVLSASSNGSSETSGGSSYLSQRELQLNRLYEAREAAQQQMERANEAQTAAEIIAWNARPPVVLSAAATIAAALELDFEYPEFPADKGPFSSSSDVIIPSGIPIPMPNSRGSRFSEG